MVYLVVSLVDYVCAVLGLYIGHTLVIPPDHPSIDNVPKIAYNSGGAGYILDAIALKVTHWPRLRRVNFYYFSIIFSLLTYIKALVELLDTEPCLPQKKVRNIDYVCYVYFDTCSPSPACLVIVRRRDGW